MGKIVQEHILPRFILHLKKITEPLSPAALHDRAEFRSHKRHKDLLYDKCSTHPTDPGKASTRHKSWLLCQVQMGLTKQVSFQAHLTLPKFWELIFDKLAVFIIGHVKLIMLVFSYSM